MVELDSWTKKMYALKFLLKIHILEKLKLSKIYSNFIIFRLELQKEPYLRLNSTQALTDVDGVTISDSDFQRLMIMFPKYLEELKTTSIKRERFL